MILNDLEKIGFSHGEAQLYLAALELGEAPMQRIAQKAGIKRTTAYGLADMLIEKGVLSITKHRGVHLYYAESPHKIGQFLSEKTRTFTNALPELLSIANFMTKKPTIRYFEGKNIMREIYSDVLNYPKCSVREWCSEKSIAHYDTHTWLITHYMPQRIAHKIFTQIITQENARTKKFQKQDTVHLRETRLDPHGHLFENNILLFGNKSIAISSLDDMMSFVIESKSLHNTLSYIFDVHWRSLHT